MDMAHLGQGVPYGIVDCAPTDFATFNMCNRYPQGQRHSCWGKHLVSIGNEQKHIGPHGGETIGKRKHSNPNTLCHSHITVRAEQTLQAGGYGKAILFGLADRATELRGKMGCDNNELEVGSGGSQQLLQRPVQMTVIGSRSSNDSDRPPHAVVLSVARSLNICWRRILGT